MRARLDLHSRNTLKLGLFGANCSSGRHYVIDNADWAAVDHIMAMRGVTRDKYPDDFEERRAHQANGMGGVPIVGDPDDVAGELASLSAAGARGIAVSFVNYIEELPFFCAEVLPRLQRSGLRCTDPR
jgi:alkanesulfonate monooxygenase SsuD/methylene tetrahydromethanopterin reductase-like flavin-dependent oxidoreductase (luciferase family)